MPALFRKLIIDSYAWVALGAACFSAMSSNIAGISLNFPNLLFSFGGTLAIYNFHRWFKLEAIQWRSSKFILFCLGSVLALFSLFSLERWETALFIGLASILSVLYIVPSSIFSSSLSTHPMREQRGWKLWLIAITWTIVTVFIPLFWSDVDLDLQLLLLLSIERLCYIAAITIPFDIRDIYLDDPSLSTIPQRFGTRKSLELAVLLLLVSAVMVIVLHTEGHIAKSPLIAILGADLLTLILIARSKVHRQKWYYAFVLDGLMILHPVAYFIAQKL